MGVVAARAGIVALLVWMAREDLRFREVSPWALAGVAVLGAICGALGHTLASGWWWALVWLAVGYVSRMGGADAKALASLALCGPAVAILAFGGMAGWYVGWRLWRKEAAAPVLPGAAVVVAMWLVFV